jgi:hypothetical protein
VDPEVPAAQVVQTVKGETEVWPAAQGEQLVDPATEVKPAGQALQRPTITLEGSAVPSAL